VTYGLGIGLDDFRIRGFGLATVGLDYISGDVIDDDLK